MKIKTPNDSEHTPWKPELESYSGKKAIEFPDKQERHRVLEALWNDPDFQGMPRDYAGALILIVPDRAVDLLQKKSFKFTVQDIT